MSFQLLPVRRNPIRYCPAEILQRPQQFEKKDGMENVLSIHDFNRVFILIIERLQGPAEGCDPPVRSFN